MTTYAVRPCGSGWIAGVAHIRTRKGRPTIGIRHGKHAASAEEAVGAARTAWPPERARRAASEPEGGRALPSRPKSPPNRRTR